MKDIAVNYCEYFIHDIHQYVVSDFAVIDYLIWGRHKIFYHIGVFVDRDV